MSLKDQVVLVTGSSGGIGDAVVDALTAEGALVIGADRAPKEGQELAGFFPLDITSEQQCAQSSVTSQPSTAASMSRPRSWSPGHHAGHHEDNDRRVRFHHADQRSGTFSMVRETAQSMLGTGTQAPS